MQIQDAWIVYYSALASWTLHPGWQRPGCTPPTLQDCANIADQMTAITIKQLGARPPWQDTQPPEPQ